KNYVCAYLPAIGLRPTAWTEALKKAGEPAAFIGDILEAGFQNPQAVVVILTGDDMARVKEPYGSEKLTEQPRANVLFEAGMALGRFPKRTIFVQVGEVRPFSDLAGRHVFRLDREKGVLKDL